MPIRYSVVLCLTHRSLLNPTCGTRNILLDFLHVSMIWYVLLAGEYILENGITFIPMAHDKFCFAYMPKHSVFLTQQV
jgi:hypothetical protein